jgi:fatty acid CoA ligase FadD9
VLRTAVQEAKIGAVQDIPHLSAALIDRYVTDLRHLGLI